MDHAEGRIEALGVRIGQTASDTLQADVGPRARVRREDQSKQQAQGQPDEESHLETSGDNKV